MVIVPARKEEKMGKENSQKRTSFLGLVKKSRETELLEYIQHQQTYIQILEEKENELIWEIERLKARSIVSEMNDKLADLSQRLENLLQED